MKYVPAIQEEYIQSHRELQGVVEYLLSKEDSKTLSFSLSEMSEKITANKNLNLRRDYSPDYSTITFSLVEPTFDIVREGLLWIGVPEIGTEDLVPHG